jgi:hypothetical protein
VNNSLGLKVSGQLYVKLNGQFFELVGKDCMDTRLDDHPNNKAELGPWLYVRTINAGKNTTHQTKLTSKQHHAGIIVIFKVTPGGGAGSSLEQLAKQ